MKKVSLILFFSAVLILKAVASDNKTSWSIQTGVMSEYLGRIGAIFDKSPIAVTSISVSHAGFYAYVWNATSFGGHKYGTTYGDEFDFGVGYTHTFGWIKTDISASYYAIAELGKMNDDIWAIEPEISLPKFPYVEPYIRARYFGEVGSQSPKSGMFYFVGVRRSIMFGHGLANRPYALNLNAEAAYAGGALHDFTGFVCGRISASVDVPLSKSWTVSPSVIYQVSAPGEKNDPNGFTGGNHLVGGVMLKASF